MSFSKKSAARFCELFSVKLNLENSAEFRAAFESALATMKAERKKKGHSPPVMVSQPVDDFPFISEPPTPFDDDDDFWCGKKIMYNGIRCVLTKTGIIYKRSRYGDQQEDPTFIGVLCKDSLLPPDELPNEVREWIAKCDLQC
jgi:hypothetical protein